MTLSQRRCYSYFLQVSAQFFARGLRASQLLLASLYESVFEDLEVAERLFGVGCCEIVGKGRITDGFLPVFEEIEGLSPVLLLIFDSDLRMRVIFPPVVIAHQYQTINSKYILFNTITEFSF